MDIGLYFAILGTLELGVFGDVLEYWLIFTLTAHMLPDIPPPLQTFIYTWSAVCKGAPLPSCYNWPTGDR